MEPRLPVCRRRFTHVQVTSDNQGGGIEAERPSKGWQAIESIVGYANATNSRDEFGVVALNDNLCKTPPPIPLNESSIHAVVLMKPVSADQLERAIEHVLGQLQVRRYAIHVVRRLL